MGAASGKDMIHVVLAADSNYAMPLAVAMCSAAANCNQSRRLVFHVVQSEFDPHLRAKLERSVARTAFPNARVIWIEAPLERVANVKIVNKWLTAMTLVRLVLPELLPSEVHKVLYLDCDVVVNEDLGELWDMDIGEKSLFAARDTIGSVGNPDGGLSNYRELGIPGDAKYFNAGVLLLNLKKWRERGTSEQLLRYMRDHQAILRYEDQEVLNAVLFDDWGELEFRWNWQIVWRGVRIGTHKMAWAPERGRKSIIHFITGEKPWLPGCDYEEKKYFFHYLDQTEWAGWRVPWYRELYCRSVRPLGDARNALGRLRRKLM